MEDRKRWEANWIWAAPAAQLAGRNELVYFRKIVNLPLNEAPTGEIREAKGTEEAAREAATPSKPAYTGQICVTADSLYHLYVNGQAACAGPCRGDLRTHYYETVDIGSLLKPGRNIIAVKVLHFAYAAPRPDGVLFSPMGGLLLEGSIHAADSGKAAGPLAKLVSDESWRCLRDTAIHNLPETLSCVGGPEEVDGSLIPHGWESAGYNEDGLPWAPAVAIAATEEPSTGFLTPWQLAPRPIPLMFQRDQPFKRIMRVEGDPQLAGDFPSADGALRVQAGATVAIELDAGLLTTGYLEFAVQGAAGAELRFLCSESYETPEGAKGVRDETAGKLLRGHWESYRLAGGRCGDTGEIERYAPFQFRTFRFVRVEVTAGQADFTLHSVHYRETGYPLEVSASFACSDPSMLPLWEVSLNTLQRCMHDNYFDCPYYEQLQYSMDTRLQILFTYAISGDDRLARKAIHDLHSSMLPSGMLQSRYPAVTPQVIPGFALYWVMMVHDHLAYFGDLGFAARYRPTIDAVLGWFAREVGADGLIAPAPRRYWSYVDWVSEWESTRGVPSLDRPLAVYTLLYADALRKAADINEHTGRPDTAREYRERANDAIAAVRKACWSEERGLYRDAPGLEQYSQHTQIWAILSGAAVPTEAEQLAQALISNSALAKVSYAMAFYLFRALAAAGRYADTYPLWEMWHAQIRLHLTSWLEDPVSERSDCHAWGAVPLYEFTSEILGVKPLGIGYERIAIVPKPGPLTWAKGLAAVGGGAPVRIAWAIVDGCFTLEASGLDDRPVEAILPDGTVHAFAGQDAIRLECPYPQPSSQAV